MNDHRFRVAQQALHLAALFMFSILPGFAQEPEKLPPEIPFLGYHSPLAQHQATGGFWRLDHTFTSVLTIKNLVENAPLTVTPILTLADGTARLLPSLMLAPAGVATVDIEKAVAESSLSSAPGYTSNGTIDLQYSWHWGGAVLAEVQNLDVDRSLSFVSGLSTEVLDPTLQTQTLEGIWWKRTPHTGGFLRSQT